MAGGIYEADGERTILGESADANVPFPPIRVAHLDDEHGLTNLPALIAIGCGVDGLHLLGGELAKGVRDAQGSLQPTSPDSPSETRRMSPSMAWAVSGCSSGTQSMTR
jgi:hypothetical protein